MSQQIITVTPNLALDHTVVVENFVTGQVYKTVQSTHAAGGKGMNVARALKTLHHTAVNMGFAGGYIGKFVDAKAKEDGLHAQWTWIKEETRICTIIVDRVENSSTDVNEQGPLTSATDWERLSEDILAQANTQANSHVCLCGSLPRGASLEYYPRLIQALLDAGHLVWVDTSSTALIAAATVQPSYLKINQLEAEVLLNRPITTPEDCATAIQTLCHQGLDTVIITQGGDGAMAGNLHGVWQCKAPAIQVVSTTGSGDSFLAGMLHGIHSHQDLATALKAGVASGSANALSIGGGKFTLEAFDKLYQQVHVEQIK